MRNKRLARRDQAQAFISHVEIRRSGPHTPIQELGLMLVTIHPLGGWGDRFGRLDLHGLSNLKSYANYS